MNFDSLKSIMITSPKKLIGSLLLGIVCIAISVGVSVAQAQPMPQPIVVQPTPSSPATSIVPSGPNPAPVKSAEVAPPRGDLIYLPDKNGNLVPVPLNTDLDKYLKFVEETQKKTGQPEANYSITSLKFDGKVIREPTGDEFLELKTNIVLNVLQPGWLEVPLRMLEATVIDAPVYKGQGEVFFKNRDRNIGQIWYVRGQMEHTIQMTMLVPVRKQFNTRRVQLSVPTSLRSELNLEVPSGKVLFKTNDDSKIFQNHVVGNQTKATLVGFNERLDLSWTIEPNTSQNQATLESDFALTIQEDPLGFNFLVQQQVLASVNDLTQLNIQLPRDLELVKIEADGLISQVIRKKEGRDYVDLNFERPLVEPKLLRWQFRIPTNKITKSLVIDGLKLKGASRETGVIKVEKTTAKRLVPSTFNSQVVIPVSVESVSENRNLNAAFRVNSVPFEIQFDVVTIEPYFTAEPHNWMIVNEHECEVTSTWKMNVFRGMVSTLEIRWPGIDLSHWNIDITCTSPNRPENLVQNIRWPTSIKDDIIQIELNEPLNGEFDVQVQCRFEHQSNQEPFSFTFPTPVASIVHDPRCVLASAVNVETQLQPLADTELIPIKPEEFSTLVKSPTLFNSTSYKGDQQYFRLKGNVWSLLCNVRSFQRSVQTTSRIVSRYGHKKIEIVQSLNYRIEHEPLHQVQLKIPKVAENVTFSANSQQPNMGNLTTMLQPDGQHVVLMFENPVLGTCEIEARYALPLPAETTKTPEAIPIITSLDGDFTRVEYEPSPSSEGQLIPQDSNWKLTSQGLNEEYVWDHPFPVTNPLAVSWNRASIQTRYDYSICMVRYRWDSPQSMSALAIYQLKHSPEVLNFSLADNLFLDTIVYWDGQPLNIDVTDRKKVSIKLPPQKNNNQNHQLIIPFNVQFNAQGWGMYPQFSLLKLWSLEAPRINSGTWVHRTIWDLELPEKHVLTQCFTHASSLNRWMLNYRGFSLSSRLPGNDRTMEMVSNRDMITSMHHYTFLTQGPGSQLNFMTVPLIVLIFSGLLSGLVLMFLCLRTRRVIAFRALVLVAAGILVAYYVMPWGAILWGQYFLIGLALGLTACHFDDTFRQSQSHRPVIVFSSDHSSFQSMPGLKSSTSSEELTHLHQPAGTKEESNSGQIKDQKRSTVSST